LINSKEVDEKIKEKVQRYMDQAVEDVILAFYIIDDEKVYALINSSSIPNNVLFHTIELVDIDDILNP
jgi:hypothetical protein